MIGIPDDQDIRDRRTETPLINLERLDPTQAHVNSLHPAEAKEAQE